MIESRFAPRVAIELDALRRYMDANAERIEHVAAFMCRGKNAIAPRDAFEKAARLDHKLAICQRRLHRLKQVPRG
jgi:hypothetical protein